MSIFNLIGLIGLQVLNIQDNQVEELPYHLVRLTKLATLEIADNRITEPPAEISRLGIGNIIKYLTRKNQAYKINSLDLSSLGLEVCFTSTEVHILTLNYLLYQYNRTDADAQLAAGGSSCKCPHDFHHWPQSEQ